MNQKPKQRESSRRNAGMIAMAFAMGAFCLAPTGLVQTAYAAPANAPLVAPAAMNISGTVVDQNGEAVIGATVAIKGTKTATMTDIDGKFTLQAEPGQTITVSYIGMASESVSVVSGKTVYNFNLKEDAAVLDDVVVVGYGQQKKVNLTGSVSAVNMDKVAETRPITNVGQALAGLAAGVTVTSTSNQPGADNPAIRVRGVGTLNTASPLIIIDGVEAGINTVNPADIESMSVLKDAASAAIYGSRAANGVILITTKKGKAGSVKVNYNGYVSFESVHTKLKPVSNYADYMELMNEGMRNSGMGEPFSQASIDEWRANENGDQIKYPNTNWIKETFKPATSTNHTVSMSGGTDKIRFYSSFGFNHNPGVMPNAAYTQYNARVSVEADVTKWLTLSTLASGYRGETEPGARMVDDIFTYASATTPGMVFQAPDGRFGGMNNGEDDSQCQVNNPISRAYRVEGNTRKNNSRVRFSGILRPFQGFSLTGNYNYELVDTEGRSKPHFVQGWNFKDDVMVYDSTGKTSVSYSDAKVERYFWDAVARYENNFGNLGFQVMAGVSNELYRSKSFSTSRQDLVDLNLWALSAATGDASASGSSTEWSMLSYFGRINLNWADKYLLELNIRRDGSSRFQKGRRWGNFPSASAGWRLDQESFMEPLVDMGLNALKLRASYGELGNNSIGNYETQALYSTSNYVLGNSLATGLVMGALPNFTLSNAALTWESTSVLNVGADVTLFQNRLTGSIEYFYKKTKNILISLPAPAVHGTTSLPSVNSAQVSNRGFDLNLVWNDAIGKVTYSANANISYVKNNVDKFKGKDVAGRSISGTNLIWEGYPINTQYMLRVDRIIQTDEDLQIVNDMLANDKNAFAAYGKPEKGDFLYKDINGDGKINADDREIINVTPNPNWQLSLNLNAGWNGFDFGVLLHASLGAKRYWNSFYNEPMVRYGYQLNQEVCDGRWYEGRTDATYPRLLINTDSRNLQASDFYLEDISYLKIRNIQLGYTLPSKWMKTVGIDRVRVYGSLENFFTFTKFKGFDPEVSGMAYPTMRQAVIGLNVSF